MILNLRPSNPEYLEPVIEEQEARFGDGGDRDDRNGNQGGNQDENGGGNGVERILRVIKECMGGDYDDGGNGERMGEGVRDDDEAGGAGGAGGAEAMEGVEM